MPYQRTHDPSGPGLLLIRDGEPVACVVWMHDYAERARTGWFVVPVDEHGEPEHDRARRLAVTDDVERLVADTELRRDDWLARAEAFELLTATAAVDAAERLLDDLDQ
jgi:hypothetical protein